MKKKQTKALEEHSKTAFKNFYKWVVIILLILVILYLLIRI